MKKFLFYFALTGWLLGFLVHFLSLADIDVSEKVSFIWLLHIGIFVVCIPVVLDLKKNEALMEYQQSGGHNRINPIGFFKMLFKGTPKWMSALVITGFFYGIFNFAWIMFSRVGIPFIEDGHYLLKVLGRALLNVTEELYHYYKANELRGFSGIWISFYGIATAALYKFSGFLKEVETR